MYRVHVLFAVVLAVLRHRDGGHPGVAVVRDEAGHGDRASRWSARAWAARCFRRSAGCWSAPTAGGSSLMIYAIFPAVLVARDPAVRPRAARRTWASQPLGAGEAARGGGPPASGLDYREAMRTRTFWMIAAAGSMTFYAILGISAHLFLHLRGQGFDVPTAARGPVVDVPDGPGGQVPVRLPGRPLRSQARAAREPRHHVRRQPGAGLDATPVCSGRSSSASAWAGAASTRCCNC